MTPKCRGIAPWSATCSCFPDLCYEEVCRQVVQLANSMDKFLISAFGPKGDTSFSGALCFRLPTILGHPREKQTPSMQLQLPPAMRGKRSFLDELFPKRTWAKWVPLAGNLNGLSPDVATKELCANDMVSNSFGPRKAIQSLSQTEVRRPLLKTGGSMYSKPWSIPAVKGTRMLLVGHHPGACCLSCLVEDLKGAPTPSL